MRFQAPKAKIGGFIWFFVAIVAVGVVLPVWLTVRISWGAATMSYDVTPDEVVITFGPDVVTIDRSTILDVYVLEAPSRGRRNFGTSTPGLKEGNWSFEETGRITLYATTTRDLVVIETPDRKWGITPENPHAFQQAVQMGQPGHYVPVDGGGVGGLFGIIILIGITSVVVGVLLYYMVRVARRIEYELGPTAILIHGGWRPIEIPYDKITEAKVDSPKGTPIRTFGMSIPRLHWGTFSWRAAGPNLRLYATRLRPIVLIAAGYRTFGITPEDTEKFMAELSNRLPDDSK